MARPFRVTFGQRYRREPHPAGEWVHPDGWLTVLGADEDEARDRTVALLGIAWAFIYAFDSPDGPTLDLYPRGELARWDGETLILQHPTE